MRIVTQFQYFPENKQESATLIVLDNKNDIWLQYNPMIDGGQWYQIALPKEFYKETK